MSNYVLPHSGLLCYSHLKVLHTADWHLGQRLQSGHDRHAEHQHFLHWLTATIAEQQVEVLVVAGDVFDTGNPPSAALELYYSFLVGLRQTGCRDVVGDMSPDGVSGATWLP